jgi:hypothetical protein
MKMEADEGYIRSSSRTNIHNEICGYEGNASTSSRNVETDVCGEQCEWSGINIIVKSEENKLTNTVELLILD